MHAEAASAKIFDAVAVTGTNTYYSGSTTLGPRPVPGNAVGSDVNGATGISVVGKLTGTPVGTMTIEVSNSSDKDIALGQDVWDTDDSYQGGGFTNGVASVAAGQISSNAVFKIKGTCRYRRMRLKYVNASSNGTLSATLTIKRF